MRADCARHGTQSADGTYTRPTVCMLKRNQSGLPMISHGFLGIQNPSKISLNKGFAMMKPANVLSRVGYYHASSFISVLVVHLMIIYLSFTIQPPPITTPFHSSFSFIIGLTRIWPRFIRMSSSCQVDLKKTQRLTLLQRCCQACHPQQRYRRRYRHRWCGGCHTLHGAAMEWIEKSS